MGPVGIVGSSEQAVLGCRPCARGRWGVRWGGRRGDGGLVGSTVHSGDAAAGRAASVGRDALDSEPPEPRSAFARLLHVGSQASWVGIAAWQVALGPWWPVQLGSCSHLPAPSLCPLAMLPSGLELEPLVAPLSRPHDVTEGPVGSGAAGRGWVLPLLPASCAVGQSHLTSRSHSF